jgi:arylsulfatase A-like enzyme
MDVFGAPVEAPNMRRIAEAGVRYSNFHTTALCSPTRASPLTGRNATSNGMATIAEFGSGFPGISARIPFENGFISEVLAEQGYNTEPGEALWGGGLFIASGIASGVFWFG